MILLEFYELLILWIYSDSVNFRWISNTLLLHLALFRCTTGLTAWTRLCGLISKKESRLYSVDQVITELDSLMFSVSPAMPSQASHSKAQSVGSSSCWTLASFAVLLAISSSCSEDHQWSSLLMIKTYPGTQKPSSKSKPHCVKSLAEQTMVTMSLVRDWFTL